MLSSSATTLKLHIRGRGIDDGIPTVLLKYVHQTLGKLNVGILSCHYMLGGKYSTTEVFYIGSIQRTTSHLGMPFLTEDINLQKA